MIETIGWIGSLLLAYCALPQVILTIRTKSAKGISWGFLLMWSIGEILTFIYIVSTTMSPPLLINYGLNIIFLVIIIFYKLREL